MKRWRFGLSWSALLLFDVGFDVEVEEEHHEGPEEGELDVGEDTGKVAVDHQAVDVVGEQQKKLQL